MKKQLLFVAGAMLVVSGANAQITLNNSSYTSSQVRNDSFKMTTAASTHPSFAAATNAMWDLTTVTDTTAFNVIQRVSDAPLAFADSNLYNFAGVAYQGNVGSDINATGYTQNSIKIAGNYLVLPSATTDTLFVSTQNSVFTAQGSATAQPKDVIKFPATMSSTWTNTYESNFSYELSYVAPSPLPPYVHAPGIVKSYITEVNTVIGWGKMKVKTAAGASSGYMDVLQVRTQTTRVDTFYLNGGTTDIGLGTLLSTLGFTQGQVTKTYTQNFYRTNEVSPLAYVTFSDSANTTPTTINTHKQRLATSVSVANVVNENNINIYPNPVSGRTLSIDMPVVAGNCKYELVNIAGQTVAADVLTNTHTQVQLAATVTPGTYYIRVLSNGAQVAVKTVVIN